jgi:acetyl-CoA acetyltransferase
MSGVFLVAAKRTPFGAFGGALKAFSATDLGVISTLAALESANLDPKLVDSVLGASCRVKIWSESVNSFPDH